MMEPMRIDSQPVCIGGESAIPAAANDAIATGGVMADSIPQ